MPDLLFEVRGVAPMRAALTPSIAIALTILNRPETENVLSIVLRCQVLIEAPRRTYTDQERNGLRDLFGEPERWGQTLRPLLWTNISTSVPAFTRSIDITLPLPCTCDFNVAVSRFFHGLDEAGSVPLTLLFSGTAFYADPNRGLQAAPIAWSSEARFPFPIRVWNQTMDLYYPNERWLAVNREVFSELVAFKSERGFATLDDTLQHMLDGAREVPV